MTYTSTLSSAADPASDRFPWAAMLVLAAAGFLALTVELSPAGLLTRIAPDLHASVAATGSLTALYSLGNALLALPLTSLTLRFTRRFSLAGALVVFVAGNLLVAASTGLGPALIGRFVAGGAHGLLMSLAPAVAAGMAGPRREARALSMVIGANTLGIALGAPLASFVGTTLGWRTSFIVAAAVALACMVLLILTIPPVRARRAESLGLLRVAREPGVLRIGLGWALLMLGYMGVITYVDSYLEEVGAPPALTSVVLFVFGVGGFAGVWIAGFVAARSRLAALIGMPLLMAASLAVLAAGIASVPVILVLVFVWGAAFAGLVLAWQQALLLAGHRAPEMAMGIGVVLTQAGMALGSALGGIVVGSLGVFATPLLGAGFALVALLTLIRVPALLRRAEEARAVQ
ncbi:MFS transporter [Amycolatopsis rubida]|uniref:MFS transporter n=1 Tax=Amycolatopsis rubida TaxID=112413 RepID=A0ABX0C3C1_9PSEU|nr:MFS transporter [Amycolatopsis sp. M39]MYW96103.1 MFS transporter [Amycolatopsis rubida]NEC61094.1 MFS transporter [Amycolatopsis rubida]